MKKELFKDNIKYMEEVWPYKRGEYSKKTWGHPLHSLCSYQGKLKPSVAHWLIKLFTEEENVVLDPLGGVGTIALEACLQGRIGLSNDISILASTVACAKVTFPNRDLVWREFEKLKEEAKLVILSKKDFEDADFGLNASVKDYFHEDTLKEILQFKKVLDLGNSQSPERCFVASNLLHILHGNRPYALSRNSHALTPFSPSGEFIYKNVSDKVEERLTKTLSYEFERRPNIGRSFYGTYESLSNIKVDAIITSPPFVGMRFDRPNWMRLWLCGWEKNDFLETSKNSLDRQQTDNWDIYNIFFKDCYKLLNPNGIMVLHLGGSSKYNMVKELEKRAEKYFEVIDIISEDVSNVENHGVVDKGTTNKHIFMFLYRKGAFAK